MIKVIYKAVPYEKTAVSLALEAGVDAIITEAAFVEEVSGFARVEVFKEEDFETITLHSSKDEETAIQLLKMGKQVILGKGWEIIPVENILAQSSSLAVEVDSLDEAILASGILERGVSTIIVLPEAAKDIAKIVKSMHLPSSNLEIVEAEIKKIIPAGLGHRVCVDTMSVLSRGQGMLVGDSSSFTFLVHAETEKNEFVASRPFRINAGGVHAYALMPGDRTKYLQEVNSGDEVLIIDSKGSLSTAIVGRAKVEVRPMLQVIAEANGKTGSVFLQNAETIRLVLSDGTPISVVALKEGDKILAHLDKAGRHFGMRVEETIQE